MSDLRKQFLDRMNLYGLSEHTKRSYVTSVKGLAKFYNQSPDQLTDDQVQGYLRIPRHVGQSFQSNPATHYDPFRPPIPEQSGHNVAL